MRTKLVSIVSALAVLLALSESAHCKTQQVDISACANAQIDDGQPVGRVGGNAGTPLSRQRFKLLNPAVGNNVWLGKTEGSVAEIALSVQGVSAVYALLNTGYGQPDISNLNVSFVGTGAAHAEYQLVGNHDIRDHWNWVWTNEIDDRRTQEWWTNNPNPQPQDQTHRWDIRKFDIGAQFNGQTLTKIVFTAPAGAAPNFFQPLVAAVKVIYGATAGPATCTAN